MPISSSGIASFAARIAPAARRGSLIVLPKGLQFSTSTKFNNVPRAKDDMSLHSGMQSGAAEARRAFSQVASPPKAFRKEQVTLKDGTQATVSSADLLTPGSKDIEDLSAFYHGLSNFSGIKGDRCSDRAGGGSSDVVFHAPRQLEIAQGCVRKGGRVLVMRAEVEGRLQIIGACMYDRRDDEAAPHRMVTSDACVGKGVASMLKVAQIECAQADGCQTMKNFRMPEPEVLRAYDKACKQLNLKLDLSGWGPKIDLRPGSAIAPRKAEVSA